MNIWVYGYTDTCVKNMDIRVSWVYGYAWMRCVLGYGYTDTGIRELTYRYDYNAMAVMRFL